MWSKIGITVAGLAVIGSHWSRFKQCKMLLESNAVGMDKIVWSSRYGYYLSNSADEAKREENEPCNVPVSRIYVGYGGNVFRRDPVLSSHTSCVGCDFSVSFTNKT